MYFGKDNMLGSIIILCLYAYEQVNGSYVES
jgi:hypothetical protein